MRGDDIGWVLGIAIWNRDWGNVRILEILTECTPIFERSVVSNTVDERHKRVALNTETVVTANEEIVT